MKVYAFVDAQKTDFTITTLCRMGGVSTSGFYDWVARSAAGPTDAERDEAEVVERIRVAHRRSGAHEHRRRCHGCLLLYRA